MRFNTTDRNRAPGRARRQVTVRGMVVGVALAGVLVVGLSSAAVAAGKSTTTTRVKDEQAITIGAEEFPPVLNDMTVQGNGEWTGMIVGPALARGYMLMPDFSYQPWLFSKDCSVVTDTPFTVDCQIRPDAKWSDGVPITADDFKFTYETIMNPKNDVVTRDGYDQITAFNVVSPTEFQMVFKEVFAPFRDLWAGTGAPVLPEHVLEGQNFNTVWNKCICDPKTKQPISSGPMLVQSFTPDTQVTLVPNPNYWGQKATVPKVVFIPTTDSDSEINAFRAGEVDMIYPQNQIGLRQKIESVPGAKYETSLGPQWEHFDMLSSVPGFNDLTVRKAIATAMPRQQIVDRVVKDANSNAQVLDNTQWMTDQKQYEPNWDVYPASGDVTKANQMLDADGWKLGSDGIRAKNGVKLSFDLGTTSGNQARELAEQIIQAQMKKIGIKMTIQNSPDILDTKMPGFDFQSLIFAWVGSPDPFGNNIIWQSTSIPQKCPLAKAKKGDCDFSGANYTKIDDPTVDSLLKQADTTTDPTVRATLYNEVDQQLATNSVTVIPLFQKPTQLGYKGTIGGVEDNPTQDGFTWNIQDWTYTGG
jgi:peptide/nickel transport system substrate-binding protein